MNLAVLKPFLSSLVLPPLGPLLLIFMGLLLLVFKKRNKKNYAVEKILIATGFVLLWLLSSLAIANLMYRQVLTSYAATNAAELQRHDIQAVIVLGGGLQLDAAEYQYTAQLGPNSATRLRYGSILARQAKLPLAFSGGISWSIHGQTMQTEAQGAQNYLQSLGLPAAKWLDGQSSDTAENAEEMAKLLKPQGFQRIALVTDEWHMTRAQLLFEKQGFYVLPAAVNLIATTTITPLDWLPSADGLIWSRLALREALALLVIRVRQ